jgi:hypothetical protein
MSKIVQIMGGAPTSQEAPPLADGVERWGLNGSHFKHNTYKFDNWTRWFDLHNIPWILQNRRDTYEWYKSQTKPILMWQRYPEIPASEEYPIHAVRLYFNRERLFLSSFDWMMALAIAEGFDQIDVYRFRLQANQKYGFQLPSAMYWVGRARGMDITVNIHGKSNLNVETPLYGYEAVDPFEFAAKLEE